MEAQGDRITGPGLERFGLPVDDAQLFFAEHPGHGAEEVFGRYLVDRWCFHNDFLSFGSTTILVAACRLEADTTSVTV